MVRGEWTEATRVQCMCVVHSPFTTHAFRRLRTARPWITAYRVSTKGLIPSVWLMWSATERASFRLA
jgi:hypothetical protein